MPARALRSFQEGIFSMARDYVGITECPPGHYDRGKDAPCPLLLQGRNHRMPARALRRGEDRISPPTTGISRELARQLYQAAPLKGEACSA
jgi:hypothetical protein